MELRHQLQGLNTVLRGALSRRDLRRVLEKVENHAHMVVPYTIWYNFVSMQRRCG